MKKNIILVTGSTGFVGSFLCEYLLEKKQNVWGAKRWRSPMNNVKHIQDKIKFIDWDMTDAISVRDMIDKVQPEVIYHLAAQSFVPYSFLSPISTLYTNICGTAHLLEAVRNSEIDPLIAVITSSEVYGQVKKEDIPITEECPLRPQSPYGVSKVGEDLITYQYFCSYGLKTIRARMFTHTGPKQHEGLVTSAFAKQIAAIELGLQKPILKVGNLDSLRTFADVRDAVRAYWLLTKKCPVGEVYNIGGNESMKVGEMLGMLLDMTNKKIKIVVDKSLLRPSDVTLQVPCTDKFRKATGWEPEIPFKRTLSDTLQFWREELSKTKNL